MSPWWDGLAPVDATVECGGETHRLRWAAGELQPLDHDDADGERALAALGGARCECVDMLDAWERHARDLRVLALGSRGPADLLTLGDATARGPAAWVSPLGSGVRLAPTPVSTSGLPRRTTGRLRGSVVPLIGRPAPGIAPDEDLVGLLGLGGSLAGRLQASVIAAWAKRIDEGDDASAEAGPRLTAALYGRLAASVRAWLGQPELAIELEMVPAGSTPRLCRTGRDRLEAELPFAWLEAVWSRGLTSVMGRFCVDATSVDGRDWTLSTLGPDVDSPETISLRLSPAGDRRALG
jgi:hypothetical protein